MTPREFRRQVLEPGLAFLVECGGPHVTAEGNQLTLTIPGQEANWSARVQAGGGPARGLFQFELGGGVRGVLTHPASRDVMQRVCARLGVPCTAQAVYEALATNDTLAVAAARMLLFTDPKPLPRVDQPDAGWAYYLRTWRPGKPRPETWAARWSSAAVALRAD